MDDDIKRASLMESMEHMINEFYMDDEGSYNLEEANNYRKLQDVFLMYLSKKSIIPKFLIKPDTTINLPYKQFSCINEEDDILVAAVDHAFHVFGWRFPKRLNYRDIKENMDIKEYFPKWFHPYLQSFSEDYDCTEEEFILNCTIITTMSNKKISSIMQYHDSGNDMEEFTLFSVKLAKVTDPYVNPSVSMNTIKYYGRYFFSCLNYELYDESGFNYPDVIFKNYYRSSLILYLKDLDKFSNLLCKKYNIKY
jgi:hypothetical protein